LRGVLSKQKNALVLLGEAGDIDPDARRVKLRDGAILDYDSLIVATGSKTSYYGKDEWREAAPSLKTIEEATVIRHKILSAFEWAERSATAAEAREWLTFRDRWRRRHWIENWPARSRKSPTKRSKEMIFARINPKDATSF